ncbi:3-hydroxyacyl-ACP dehydratase FabZ family protein [Rubellicoccus peritrichatus]|uniref:3-hydroxyacyl-ACP dehydratase FabZ family protein n=1 Tax=Rubellicoccus peritrichatus TaxID=3080537 RepID=A0AAQ3L6J9_9BACT|nr:3-hydroxyacyl-ACP dehydratase FabZ family protein [Puniceicoccus sp. CR14]WOO39582.1 3-hydroxyacyl-ACP dehydratase FabZ family protein [Puniceicoccus sp. CR14]
MQEILDSIPHRPPFLFVDEIIESTEASMTGRRTWRADEGFYEGHYPGNPITPGVLLCEAVFQTAAVFLSKKLAAEMAEGERTPVLSRIQDAKFKRMVKPGDVVDIEVTYKETAKGFHFMRGRVLKDGKPCVALDFVLAMVDESKV